MRLRETTSNRARLVIFVLVGAATVLAHGRSLTLPWLTLDDQVYVTTSPFLHPPSLGGLRDAWTRPYYHDYIPVTHTTYWLDARIWGARVFGYHAQSILWHVLGAWLTVWVLARMCGDVRIGAAAGILFAAHPLTVESVAWVSSRKNVVSFALMMGAFFLFQKTIDARDDDADVRASTSRGLIAHGRERTRWLGYGASFVLFVLSVLAKTNALVLPGLLLLDLWVRRPDRIRSALVLVAPFAAASLLMLPVLASVRSDQPEVRLGGSMAGTLAADVPILARYVAHTVWPRGLAIIYAVKAGSSLTWALLIQAVCILSAALLLPFAWIGRRRLGAALIGWTVAGLLPSLNTLPQANPAADRFVYWSLPALIAFFVLAFVEGAQTLGRLGPVPRVASPPAPHPAPSLRRAGGAMGGVLQPFGALLGIAAIGLGVLSAARTPLFGSTLDLIEDAQRKNPESSLANLHLAVALTDRYDMRQNESVRDRVAGLYQAMMAAPDAGELIKPAALDRGVVFISIWHAKRGRPDQGDQMMRVQFAGRSETLEVANAWGRYFLATGRFLEAETRLRKVLLESGPASGLASVRELRDNLLRSQELPFDRPALVSSISSDVYGEALERRELFTATQLLGRAYRGLGQARDALGLSSVSAALEPDDTTALQELAADYHAIGDERRARAVEARLAQQPASESGGGG